MRTSPVLGTMSSSWLDRAMLQLMHAEGAVERPGATNPSELAVALGHTGEPEPEPEPDEPGCGEGPAARDDRLTVTDARDYCAHLILRRALVEWRVLVLQGQARGGGAIKRLREEYEAQGQKLPRR